MRILLAALTFLILATLSLLTAPAVTYLQVQAQPITPTALEGPGTTLLTTFPNGSSRVTWVNGTTVQFLNGVGVLIVDPSVSAAAAAAASAPVSNTVVNRIVQQLAIAIAINIEEPDVNQTLPPINDTLPPIIPLPPQPNDTEPGGPDEQCLFDPSLPHCAPVDGECPDGFAMNANDQCFPTGGCPDGYHSIEDDESGTCYSDEIPCPDGQIKSEDGNWCEYPAEPEPVECEEEGLALNPSTGECEPAFFIVECDGVILYQKECPEGTESILPPTEPAPAPPITTPPEERGGEVPPVPPPEDDGDDDERESATDWG